jgi:glyoxylase-like metal-dependent hydrolase (beta-lactamase superfamily II)
MEYVRGRKVVITHAHWDHTGNLGQFPGAEIVMSQAEYGFWTSALARRKHFDLLAGLAAQPGARLVAGHDPEVRARFAPHPAHPAVTDLGRPRD